MRKWAQWVILFLLGCSGDPREQPTAKVRAAVCSPPCPIVDENQLQGNPRTEWDVFNTSGSVVADTNLVGFTTTTGGKASISFAPGETVVFKVKSPVTYSVKIYRLGYY